jgi:hypothetical protein
LPSAALSPTAIGPAGRYRPVQAHGTTAEFLLHIDHLHTELDEERDGGREVVDDDADMAVAPVGAAC